MLKALMRAVRGVAGGLVKHPVTERFELSTEVLNFLQKCQTFYRSVKLSTKAIRVNGAVQLLVTAVRRATDSLRESPRHS